MAFDPITAGIDLVKTFADKFWGDKMTEQEKKGLEMQAALHVTQAAQQENSMFREFILAYEGAAKDVPHLVVIFRALIRPVFTCGVGYWDWLYFTAGAPWPAEQASLLKAINLIVLIFWFGERAVTNAGLVDALKLRILNKKEG